MNAQYRYEIKFVLNQIQLSDFIGWMWASTAMKVAYPARVVNSLYFDDVNFQSVKDNLAGLSHREKYRFRWYSSADEKKDCDPAPLVQGLKLEKKIREGRLGYKKSCSLTDIQEDFLSMTCLELKFKTESQFRELGLYKGNMLPDLFPALQVNYRRQYFEDLEGIRVTIDTDLDFYNVDANQPLFKSKPISYSKNIVEIKFPPDCKDLVSAMLSSLHIVPQRCSKYLYGLAMNGVVTYL